MDETSRSRAQGRVPWQEKVLMQMKWGNSRLELCKPITVQLLVANEARYPQQCLHVLARAVFR